MEKNEEKRIQKLLSFVQQPSHVMRCKFSNDKVFIINDLRESQGEKEKGNEEEKKLKS